MAKLVLYYFFLMTPRIIMDTPLLFESKLHKFTSKSILVYCEESVEKERLMNRDQINQEQAMKRIQSQLSLSKKKEIADYVIDNSFSKVETENQTRDLLMKESALNPSLLSTIFWYVVLFVPAVVIRLVIAVSELWYRFS
eukprot:TRINITY_DN4629_c0_g1_i1.p1 TRINITY_DN4629_c0_g1~~TRINITY_DN4629_c0_g1_i1.p1  ORF type:complete len:140 (-),score=22.60 TRINITY_DN4629_c0_g1_i1:60-479(-)